MLENHADTLPKEHKACHFWRESCVEAHAVGCGGDTALCGMNALVLWILSAAPSSMLSPPSWMGMTAFSLVTE